MAEKEYTVVRCPLILLLSDHHLSHDQPIRLQ